MGRLEDGRNPVVGLADLVQVEGPKELAARVTSTMITFIRSGSWRYESMMKPATEWSFSLTGRSRASISAIASSMISQRSRKSVLRISSLESK